MFTNSPKSTPTDPLRTIGRVASIASFGLFVIIVVNYVDARYEYTSELATQESLLAQESEQQLRLAEYQAAAEKMESELDTLARRAIGESELATVQDRLLELAKLNGCKIKKASPRGTTVRELRPRPDGASPPVMPPVDLGIAESQPLQIHDTGLALSIEGELKSTMAFLEALRAEPWFTATHQLSLQRDPSRPSYLATELELRFMSLERKTDGGQHAPFSPRT